MSFVAECIQDSLPIWEQCLNSPFLKKLENGTLEGSSFLGYIIDDSLYLREYAKVFAWGMTKAQTMEDIRICYSLLSFVNEGERSPDVKNTPYWPLVRDYASEDYRLSCQKWAAYTDQICGDLSSEQKVKCMQIFQDCSLHELYFWEMSEQPRLDIV